MPRPERHGIMDNLLVYMVLAGIILILHQKILKLAVEGLVSFSDFTAVDHGSR